VARPARGYSWPPFEKGNTAAMRHGALIVELVEGRAVELAPLILGANAHLDPARDGAGVLRYAMVLARIERVYQWLGKQADPVFEDVATGAVHGVYTRLQGWERQAAADEERLAVAPLTRAKLGLDSMRARSLHDEALAEFIAEGAQDG
jgi:hypothetical protein